MHIVLVFAYCLMFISDIVISFFFFNDTATTEIYTLSLHDALPIYCLLGCASDAVAAVSLDAKSAGRASLPLPATGVDRKSTRLNSSHTVISYAVFCLKKKKKTKNENYERHAHRTGRVHNDSLNRLT